jgi:hypothetical protein
MDRVESMKAFTMYRHDVPDDTHPYGTKNEPDEPQFEGVVFSDGTVAVRWVTDYRSVSIWDSMAVLLAVHGHPEYGSKLVWHDIIESPAPSSIVTVTLPVVDTDFRKSIKKAQKKLNKLNKRGRVQRNAW